MSCSGEIDQAMPHRGEAWIITENETSGPRHPMNPPSSSVRNLLPALALAVLLPSCAVAPSAPERQARTQAAQFRTSYRPEGKRPMLPILTNDSTLPDYVRFSVLNHPQVEAAYEEWRASVAAMNCPSFSNSFVNRAISAEESPEAGRSR